MKKQNKKSQLSIGRRLFGSHRRIASTSIVVVAVLVALYFVVNALLGFYYNYDQMRKQSQLEPFRTLIIRSAERSGYPAPVEAKTGDVYFPAAKLMLPANFDENGGTPVYRYRWDGDQKQLTIVSASVISTQETKLYNAFDFDGMFAAVPKLQACTRGMLLVPSGQAVDYGWLLQGSINPGSGSRWDMYTDKECPENVPAAAKLLNLKAY